MHYIRLTNQKLLLLLFLIMGTPLVFPAGAQTTVSKKEAKQWMKAGAWRQNLQIKPRSTINAVQFETQYKKHRDWWEKALQFLNRTDLATLKDGTYPIAGKNVFAAISSYVPVNKKDKQWEAHRKYADIQMVVSGEEKIGKSTVSKLKVTKPYDEKSDNENLKGPGKFYTAHPGTFFIFFPGDAHKPGLKAYKKQDKKIKKIVIKMRVD